MARLPEIVRRNPLSQEAPLPAPSGQGWAALADIMGTAADFIKPAVEDQVKIEGQKAVYRDESGQLQVDEKSVFAGEMGALHNAAAFASYLSQKGMDINATMMELSTKYEFDPDGFKQAADGYVSILREDESIPEILKGDLIAQVQEQSQRSFNGLYRGQVQRERSKAEQNTRAQRDMLADDYTSLMVAGDQEAADRVWSQIEEISRFRENAPFIMETSAEREAYLRGVRGDATYASVVRKLGDLDGADEISDELRAEIIGLSESGDLNPQQRQALYTATQGRLKAIDASALVKGLTDTSFDTQFNRVLEQAAVGGAAARSDSFTGLDGDFAKNVAQMVTDAKAAGIDLQITSAYRSPETQAQIVADNMAKHGFSAADRAAWEADVAELGAQAAGQKWRERMRSAGLTKWVAMPGTSAHQSGQAVDFAINGRLIRDPNSKAAKWIKENAAQYGLNVPMSWEPWEVRPGSLTAPNETERLRNQQILTAGKIPVTKGAEFLAGVMGADQTVALFSAPVDDAAADHVPSAMLERFPALGNMTVQQAKVWAERKMTMKTSDLAAQKVVIDQIEDDEMRSLALAELTEQIRVRSNQESALYGEYQERLLQGDPSLTKQQILEDHGLSNADQRTLVNAIDKANKKQADMADFVARMENPASGYMDPLSADTQKGAQQAYEAVTQGSDPLGSPENIAASAYITRSNARVMPRQMFNALRAAGRSQDPARVGLALETLGQHLQLSDTALGNYGGSEELMKLMADYEFYTGAGFSQEEAATQIIANREEKPKNVRDEAKAFVKGLDESVLVDHFDQWWMSHPEIGVESPGDMLALSTENQRNEMMGTFSRLAEEAYLETGDPELAKNRALKLFGRTYAVNTVSGSESRIMKFPPNGVYPAVAGSHAYMKDALEADVSAWVYGEEVMSSELTGDVAVAMVDDSPKWMSADRIKLYADERTAQEVKAGKPPSYIVYYRNDDGVLEQVPQRYDFKDAVAEASARANVVAEAAFDERPEVLLQDREIRRQEVNRVLGIIEGD